MGTLSLRLPESVHQRVRELARKDKVSANQFIAIAVAEKASAMAALDRGAAAEPAPPPDPAIVDVDAIRRRLLALAQYLRELRSVVDGGRDRYRSDWRVQRATERTLQLSIDACGDLAEHVVSGRQLRAPESTASAVDLLCDAQLIDAPLAATFTRMTRLRNLLVRDYVRLDAARVFETAAADVPGLERFADVMRKLIR